PLRKHNRMNSNASTPGSTVDSTTISSSQRFYLPNSVFIKMYLTEPRDLRNPGIYGTQGFTEPRDLPNPRDLRNPGIYGTLGFTEPRDLRNPGIYGTQGFTEPRDLRNPGIYGTQGFTGPRD
ncbi:hypothetical protein AAMO2058_001001600, partial [Amorphochlora amoebiformis]